MTEYVLSGDELRARRERAGWSQRRVARLLGIRQSQVSYMETGDRPVSHKHRARYVKLFEDEGDRTVVRDAVWHLRKAVEILHTVNGFRDHTYLIEQATKTLVEKIDDLA